MVKIRKHKVSKEIRARPKKVKRGLSKELIITIIIAGVMILSTFGIIFSSYNDQDTKETYQGFTFLRTSDGWMTIKDEQKVYFEYAPSQLDLLNLSKDALTLLESPVIIITFNPHSEQIEEIEAARLKLAQYFTINLNKAIIYGNTEYDDAYNLTIITCANSTARVPVIELRSVDENILPEGVAKQDVGTNIYTEGSCVVLASRERDWLAASERLAYGMMGIIS